MDEIVTPPEAKIESLLRLLAVLLDKLGGEVMVSRRDIEMYGDIPVVCRYVSKDYVLVRLAEEDIESDIEIIDSPENPG